MEFCGTPADIAFNQRLTLVAAYRTTCELFKLLQTLPPAYLSLWCSDISVTNEIAIGVKCGVWINDFAWLHGPHRHCHSGDMVDELAKLFWTKTIETSPDKEKYYNEVEKMTSLRAEWLKTADVEKRRENLVKILLDCSTDCTALIQYLTKLEPQTFIRVENGTMYQGFEESRGVLYFHLTNDDFQKYSSLFLRSVMDGNGLVFRDQHFNENTYKFIDNLSKAGVPVMVSQVVGNEDAKGLQALEIIGRTLFKTRVISCHFGETFAN